MRRVDVLQEFGGHDVHYKQQPYEESQELESHAAAQQSANTYMLYERKQESSGNHQLLYQ